MNAFWPGPFTIILNKTDNVPSIVTGGLNTVGVRMPNSEIARNLIKYSEVPIAAPSANISGRPSGTKISDIFDELSDKVNYIIDGGECNIGIESTVVKVVNGIPHILRPGNITAEQIKDVAGNVVIDKHVLAKIDKNQKILSPGMKYKHYAPKTKAVLVYDKDENILKQKLLDITSKYLSNKKVPLVMCIEENVQFLKDNIKSNVNIINMGNDLESISKNIFTDLRNADKYNCDIIIIQGVSSKGLGLAIMNRLLRACNYEII